MHIINFMLDYYLYRLPEALSLFSLCLHVAPSANPRAVLPVLTNFAQALLETDAAIGSDLHLQQTIAAAAALPTQGYLSSSSSSSSSSFSSSMRPLRSLASSLASKMSALARTKAPGEEDYGEYMTFLDKIERILSTVEMDL